MKRRQAVIALHLMLALMAIGCRREPVPAAQQPATQVSTTSPATQPASAAPSVVIINGQAFSFPSAKLVAVAKEGALRVTLFSNDPPEAVRETYAGNSFYFRFTLDGEKSDDLAGQRYTFRTSFTEQDQTASGLFIAGGRQTLRPADATITFDQEPGQMVVRINGLFRLIDEQMDENQPTLVKVQAMLEPPAEPTR